MKLKLISCLILSLTVGQMAQANLSEILLPARIADKVEHSPNSGITTFNFFYGIKGNPNSSSFPLDEILYSKIQIRETVETCCGGGWTASSEKIFKSYESDGFSFRIGYHSNDYDRTIRIYSVSISIRSAIVDSVDLPKELSALIPSINLYNGVSRLYCENQNCNFSTSL